MLQVVRGEQPVVLRVRHAEEVCDVPAVPGRKATVVLGDRRRVEERDAVAVLGPADRVVGPDPDALLVAAGRDLVEAVGTAVGDGLDGVEGLAHGKGLGPRLGGHQVGRHEVVGRQVRAGQHAVHRVGVDLPGRVQAAALALLLLCLLAVEADPLRVLAGWILQGDEVAIQLLALHQLHALQVERGFPRQAVVPVPLRQFVELGAVAGRQVA